MYCQPANDYTSGSLLYTDTVYHHHHPLPCVLYLLPFFFLLFVGCSMLSLPCSWTRLELWDSTALGKCTHWCDETLGNNSTQALSTTTTTKTVFFGCKKRDRQQKKKGSKEEGRQEGGDVQKMSRMNTVFILNIFRHQLLLVYNIVPLCFAALVSISLHLFHFVNLTSSCSLAPVKWCWKVRRLQIAIITTTTTLASLSLLFKWAQ